MSTYKLYYYPFRIRGEVARLLFAVAGVEYEDIRIPYEGDKPKYTQKFPFGELPVLEVDGKLLSQSHAIARYQANEFGFAGKSKWEAAEADMYSGVVEDIMEDVAKILVETNETVKANLLKTFKDARGPKLLQGFETALTNSSSGYLVGDGLTYADLALINVLQFVSDVLKADGDELISRYPNVQKHQQKIQTLPKVAAWIRKRPKSDL